MPIRAMEKQEHLRRLRAWNRRVRPSQVMTGGKDAETTDHASDTNQHEQPLLPRLNRCDDDAKARYKSDICSCLAHRPGLISSQDRATGKEQTEGNNPQNQLRSDYNAAKRLFLVSG